MSRSFGGWAPYVPVAARRRKVEREMEKLRKKGAVLSPVKIEGRQIASTFWGKAWCDNLESYRDYENRLPRGRTYVRNGSVVDLQIAPREVTAIVSGSKIYKVKVSIGNVGPAHWKTLCADCSSMCKHNVAVLYVDRARRDKSTELLFRLHTVDENEPQSDLASDLPD